MPKVTIEINVTSSEIVEILTGLANVGMAQRYAKYSRRPAKVKPRRYKNAPTKGERIGKPMKRGTKWTKKEIKWITSYAKNNPINQKIIGAFKREFGYSRSYSSLANKAYDCRRKNTK